MECSVKGETIEMSQKNRFGIPARAEQNLNTVPASAETTQKN